MITSHPTGKLSTLHRLTDPRTSLVTRLVYETGLVARLCTHGPVEPRQEHQRVIWPSGVWEVTVPDPRAQKIAVLTL